MKKMTKFLCLALALVMCFGIVACKKVEDNPKDTTSQETGTTPGKTGKEVDMEAYGKKSKELYDRILGDFYKYYQIAVSKEDVSERYAYMAIAEAKLLESGVMMPELQQWRYLRDWTPGSLHRISGALGQRFRSLLPCAGDR